MAWTFDEALADDLVTVVTRDDSAGTFELRIGELETVITVELGRFMDSEHTKFRRSHAIKTPLQIGPYLPSRDFDDYPAYALHRAVASITDYFREAVGKGHAPTEEWLVRLPLQ